MLKKIILLIIIGAIGWYVYNNYMKSEVDKAIDAIDEAASLVRVSHINQAVQLVLCDAVIKKHPDIQQIWEKIQIIDQQISHATNPPEKQLLIEQREQQEDVLAQKGLLSVDVSDIEAVVSEWST